MMHDNDLILRADVLDLVQSYGPATYDMPYGSGDMIIRPEDVMALPVVDAEPVVRCRDCKYYNITCCSPGFGWCERSGHNHGTTDDWFCADGEMKYD